MNYWNPFDPMHQANAQAVNVAVGEAYAVYMAAVCPDYDGMEARDIAAGLAIDQAKVEQILAVFVERGILTGGATEGQQAKS